MLIQDVEKKHPPFHEPAGKAAYLIETGKFAAVVPPEISKPVEPVQWSARSGQRIGDYEYPPSVYYKCPTCKQSGRITSETGKAHQTAKFGHVCGGPRQETCPADVAATYLRLFKEWRAKSQKRTDRADLLPKNNVDALLAREFGIKDKDSLIVEALEACIKNPAKAPAKA